VIYQDGRGTAQGTRQKVNDGGIWTFCSRPKKSGNGCRLRTFFLEPTKNKEDLLEEGANLSTMQLMKNCCSEFDSCDPEDRE
jgi:hypothetical protein